MGTATLTHTARRILLAAAVAAGATFAVDAADASGISLKVTGVAVVDETQGDRAVVKYLPPDTRVVVPSARHFASERTATQPDSVSVSALAHPVSIKAPASWQSLLAWIATCMTRASC